MENKLKLSACRGETTTSDKQPSTPEKLRPLEKIQLNNFRQVMLPDGANFVYLKNNTIHKTVGIEVYYQCGVQNTHDNALVELFCQVINEASFNTLRTQEQLGYIVASGVRNFGGLFIAYTILLFTFA